jgi:ZIP family zinc transporter/zinc and cadmium transporter
MTLSPLAWSLLLGTAAAAANVAGGVVVISRKHWNELGLKYFIALGAGFMLAATCLRMIPESLALSPHAPLLILAVTSSCTSSSTRWPPTSTSARRTTARS